MTHDPLQSLMMQEPDTLGSQADVLILAARRDAELTAKALEGAGYSCQSCANEEALLDTLSTASGSLLIAEERLSRSLLERLALLIQAQPAWSDLPVLIVANDSTDRLPLKAVAALGNVSMIQRPMTRDALLSTVASALRARRRQMEVRDLLAQQREQGERKDQFLAMLAHELRNPLTPIRYAAHLLQRPGLATDRQNHLAELVDRQVGHMGRIIDQLLDVSRLTRGLIQLERTRVDLCALTQETLQAHAISAQAKEILISCDCSCSVWVDGDETRLRQVLDNLIDNAIKFSPPGHGIQVRIRAQGGRVLWQVEDHGDGIEPALLPQLFDAFVQADRSLERSRGGLGLGLALVKGLVTMHGGEVSVHSDGPGQGSVFTVDLPAEHADEGGRDLSPPDEREAVSGEILIAEDNVDAAEALRMILEGHGYRVTVVHSGPDAIQALRDSRPQVLICDIGLPGISGYDVARAASSVHRPDVMIAVTGYGSAEDKAHALAAGFDAHLPKPVAVPQLLKEVAGALQGEESELNRAARAGADSGAAADSDPPKR